MLWFPEFTSMRNYLFPEYISMRDYLFKVIMVDYIKIARYNMSRWVTVERRMGTL
jgi:hypothetical protein